MSVTPKTTKVVPFFFCLVVLFVSSCNKVAACRDKVRAYRQCLDTKLSEQQEQSCRSCLQKHESLRPDEFENCAQVQEIFCDLPFRCECDACLDEINDLHECWYPDCSYEMLCKPSPVSEPSTRNCFQTTEELREKVNEYLRNNGSDTEVALNYGWPIGKWCVSNIQDFSELFSFHRRYDEAILAFNEDISQWDTSNAVAMNSMFSGAESFNQDVSSWDVSSVIDMSYMFSDASTFNQALSLWDVSSVTDMTDMFYGAAAFNQNISSWDVSSVTDMTDMFYGAAAFNQNISSWDVSSVTDMSYMFAGTGAFNQTLSSWDVSSVTDMSWMFSDASFFNQDLSSWDVSSVTDMSGMFQGASAFNQDLSLWSVSTVTSMRGMFQYATAFNHFLSSWDVSSVTDMTDMFYGAAAFNQNISSWDVSSVTDMSYMFAGTGAFNQTLSSWDVSSVTDMSWMFSDASFFNQDLSSWDVSSVTDMSGMFQGASAFNQDLSFWDVSSVTDMANMFAGAGTFNQILSPWDVSSVTNMHAMFYRASAFNQDLSSWVVMKVTDMQWMFSGATSFSQNLCTWGEVLQYSATRVDDMFSDTACPACPFLSDPDLFYEPAGPFCYHCSIDQVCRDPPKIRPECSKKSFQDCVSDCGQECFEDGGDDDRLLEVSPGGFAFIACQERIEGYTTCMASLGNDAAQNCMNCLRARAPGNARYCFELWDLFCHGPYECCDQCQPEIQKVLECYYQPCESDMICAHSDEDEYFPSPPMCTWNRIADCFDNCSSLAAQSTRSNPLEQFTECVSECADPCLLDNRRLLSMHQNKTYLVSRSPVRRGYRHVRSTTHDVVSSSRSLSLERNGYNPYFCHAEAEAAYQTCMQSLGQLAAENCATCINAKFPENPKYCSDLDRVFCYIDECGCEQCDSVIEAWVACNYPPCSRCNEYDVGDWWSCDDLSGFLRDCAEECFDNCFQRIW